MWPQCMAWRTLRARSVRVGDVVMRQSIGGRVTEKRVSKVGKFGRCKVLFRIASAAPGGQSKIICHPLDWLAVYGPPWCVRP